MSTGVQRWRGVARDSGWQRSPGWLGQEAASRASPRPSRAAGTQSAAGANSPRVCGVHGPGISDLKAEEPAPRLATVRAQKVEKPMETGAELVSELEQLDEEAEVAPRAGVSAVLQPEPKGRAAIAGRAKWNSPARKERGLGRPRRVAGGGGSRERRRRCLDAFHGCHRGTRAWRRAGG